MRGGIAVITGNVRTVWIGVKVMVSNISVARNMSYMYVGGSLEESHECIDRTMTRPSERLGT